MRLLAMLLLALPFPVLAQPSQVDSVMAVHSMIGGASFRGAVESRPRPVADTPTAPSGRAFYRVSIALLAMSSAADAWSSWGRPEANPALARPGSAFGAGSVAIKIGLLGSCFVMERLTLRRHPERYRQVAWMNVGVAGGLAAVVRRNISVR